VDSDTIERRWCEHHEEVIHMLPTLWEPFDTMRAFDREFNDIVNRLFSTPSEEGPQRTWTWKPTMEVFRDGEDLVIRADIPGVDPERDIELSVEGNILRMKGHRSFDREVSDDHRYMVERAYGEFRRDLTLPDGVDADAMNASYDSGVLTITMPLPESVKAAEPRKIPVAVEKTKRLVKGKRAA
jgi:HSP20 family protein